METAEKESGPTIAELQARTEAFLTEQMPQALHAVDFARPGFSAPEGGDVAEAARATVRLRHVRGTSDCGYLVGAFCDVLLMHLQLNVWRLVVVYRIPVRDGLDEDVLQARLARWQIGAGHAGWTIGWRLAVDADEGDRHYVETYCYACAARDFLFDAAEQLYWRTDIAQMTRHFMLEAGRYGIRLLPEGTVAG